LEFQVENSRESRVEARTAMGKFRRISGSECRIWDSIMPYPYPLLTNSTPAHKMKPMIYRKL
jgi:hypothetical protein